MYPKTVATNLCKETGSPLSFFPIAYRSVSRMKVVNWDRVPSESKWEILFKNQSTKKNDSKRKRKINK